MPTIDEITCEQGLTIQLVRGDITQSALEAIVNAANPRLQHGGGVAAAISRAGGPVIQAESDEWVKQYGPITHDSPAITSGGDMRCRHVIHAVGPVWGESDEERKLAMAVQGALKLADEHGIKSLALPAISTGIYGFPKALGATVIVETLLEYSRQHPQSVLQCIAITLIDEPSVLAFSAEFSRRKEVLR